MEIVGDAEPERRAQVLPAAADASDESANDTAVAEPSSSLSATPEATPELTPVAPTPVESTPLPVPTSDLSGFVVALGGERQIASEGATNTPVAATAVPATSTPVPATAVPAISTPVPATAVPAISTPVPATAVPATSTPVPATAVPATSTPVPATVVPATATTVPAAAPLALAPVSPSAPAYVQRGQAALARIPYSLGSIGYTINFRPETAGYRGLTFTVSRTIEVYVRSSMSNAELAYVIAHEVGHAVDHIRNDRNDRALWRNARGMAPNAAWWPTNTGSDLATPAGDFAECFASWAVGSPSHSSYGSCAGTGALVSQLANG